MNIAILTVASLGLVFSAGAFLVSAKTAHELKKAKTRIEADVESVKSKVSHNAAVVKTALGSMEF